MTQLPDSSSVAAEVVKHPEVLMTIRTWRTGQTPTRYEARCPVCGATAVPRDSKPWFCSGDQTYTRPV